MGMIKDLTVDETIQGLKEMLDDEEMTPMNKVTLRNAVKYLDMSKEAFKNIRAAIQDNTEDFLED
jgi:hypothetical protein